MQWGNGDRVEPSALRVELGKLRARIRGRHSDEDRGISRLHRSRYAKNLARRRLKQAKNGKRFPIKKTELLQKFRPSPILDALLPGREQLWRPMIKRTRTFPGGQSIRRIELRNFSFLDAPNEALAGLAKIAEAECTAYRLFVDFEDEYILDIGGFLAFYDLWPAIRHITVGGEMKKSVQRVLKSMGIDAEAQVKFHAVRSEDGNGNPDIWAMPVQRRRPIERHRQKSEFLPPQTADKAANRFGELVNAWLCADEFSMELTEEGIGNLKGIFGELLCNAERHSRDDGTEGEWAMAAFMARRAQNDGSTAYVCRVSVLNLGRSIAESFTGAHPQLVEFMDGYAHTHANRNQSVDTLRTVFALQDMVTCDPEAFEARDGGTGLQSAIEFFHDLGQRGEAIIDPRMTIVSGASCIMLKDDYVVGKRPPSPQGRIMPRQLWFNESNTKSVRPDPDYVFDLNGHFGGTLVTMAFTLDLNFLRSQLENSHDGADDD